MLLKKLILEFSRQFKYQLMKVIILFTGRRTGNFPVQVCLLQSQVITYFRYPLLIVKQYGAIDKDCFLSNHIGSTPTSFHKQYDSQKLLPATHREER
jgi:hypothetical protein